ncbi:MAG: hypothetical protein AAF650_06315 [Pseudomonadota bacterium]
MEILAGIALSIVALVLLALVGLTSIVALGLMTILGLLSDMSFKRLFFVSFGMALVAPVLLGMATFSAFADGSLERDLRDGLSELGALPDDTYGGGEFSGFAGENWQDTLEELQSIGRERDSGELTEEQARQRLRQLFDGSGGVTIDLQGGDEAQEGETLRIEID